MAELTLTVREAAEAIGISKDLAYDLVRAGRIPHVRWGGRVLVPRKALEEHLHREAAASINASAVATPARSDHGPAAVDEGRAGLGAAGPRGTGTRARPNVGSSASGRPAAPTTTTARSAATDRATTTTG